MQILGNEKNSDFLKESAESGHLSHCYIISGPDGMGKKTFAANAAAALLCENQKKQKTFTPCGYCPSCKRALSGNHPDIIKVVHEKSATLSVDEVRAQIIQSIDIKPYYGPYKIYLVEDANLMQVQAQNALLKTLEEPPSYAVIFLITDNAQGFLDTILSRSLKLDMQPLDECVIKKELSALDVSGDKAQKAAAFSRGNLGLAKEICTDPLIDELLDFIIKLLSDIKTMDALSISKAAETLSDASFNIPDAFRKWFRDVLVLKSDAQEVLYFPMQREVLFKQAENISYENINNIFNEIDEAFMRLTYNVNPKAVYEALLLRIRQNG